MKKYVKKSGATSKYNYKAYDKKYNRSRNNAKWKLQKLKSYYKKTGNMTKYHELDKKIKAMG